MAGRRKISKRSLRQAIITHRGVITDVADALGVDRSTIYNYKRTDPELATLIERERDGERYSMVHLAESIVMKQLLSGDVDIAKFVLERLGKHNGWSKNLELTGKDGAALMFSPEVQRELDALGLDPSDVVREFEAMVRAGAPVGAEID